VPTYSYRCANCDFAFDQYQAFTDDSLTVCPNCGQSQLRKVFNSIGVSFTGSGFYRNDSRAEASKSSTGAAKPSPGAAPSGDSSGKPEKKSDKKSESTPAAGGAAPSAPAAKPAASA
jgi:putative FmdB family regulatory protein